MVLPCDAWPHVDLPATGRWQGRPFHLSSPPTEAGDHDRWWPFPVYSFLELGGLMPFCAQFWDLVVILGPQEKSAGFPFTTANILVYCTLVSWFFSGYFTPEITRD